MSRSLKLYLIGVVTAGAVALVVAAPLFGYDERIEFKTSAPDPINLLLGVTFWIGLTLIASALPVRLPFGTQQGVGSAPILAATFLGGPAVGAWVAALGTTEVREIRGRIPWYGTLANHAGLVIPAFAAGVVRELLSTQEFILAIDFASAMIGSVVFYGLNVYLASLLLALRTDQPIRTVMIGDLRGSTVNNFALAPIGWLTSIVYDVAWWATLLFALPLYTTRMAASRFVEMRDMFTQTIGALAEAVDKRDPYTAKHSHRVKEIAVDIGQVMRVSDSELEALEWGGLLHDVGKIGVPDNVLLKQERLNREERMIMNAHPVLGAQIIAPVSKLAPELPIIRHHHEWYNGSIGSSGTRSPSWPGSSTSPTHSRP
jgi:putative nucleotidyltransferase with HDIG domain